MDIDNSPIILIINEAKSDSIKDDLTDLGLIIENNILHDYAVSMSQSLCEIKYYFY